MNKVKAHIRYRLKDNTIVPGVTTILQILARPALIYWAWNLGIKGEDYRKVKEKAADIGTIAHYLIECEIKGIKPDLSEYPPTNVEKAETCLLAFLEWRDSYHLETVGSEIPLVSEQYQFGGTIDWVVKNNGKLWLIDIKTGKAIYKEMEYQLAAYQQLWNENHFDKQIDKCHILQLGKEDGSFNHQTYPDLFREWMIFYHLKIVYNLMEKRGK